MSFAGSASGGFKSVKLDLLKCRDGSRPRVLLAEDSPAARVLTGALLKRIGCKVDAAEHGEEAVDYVRNGEYDLILMDIEMPVMDGMVAAKEIRTMGGAAAKTPIVALSAFLADTQKSDFWEKDFDIALSKPADKHKLHAAISEILASEPKPCEEIFSEPLDNSSVGRDVEEHKLARIFLNICQDDQVMLLKTASEEISTNSSELAVCHHRSDEKGVAIVLHKLSGLSATFAATTLFEMVMALRIEINADVVGNIEQQVQAICECAERTAQILKSKIRDLPEVSE